jgi:hypothetical protein
VKTEERDKARALFADHASRQVEVEQFWLDAVGLPRSSLGGFERPAWLD